MAYVNHMQSQCEIDLWHAKTTTRTRTPALFDGTHVHVLRRMCSEVTEEIGERESKRGRGIETTNVFLFFASFAENIGL